MQTREREPGFGLNSQRGQHPKPVILCPLPDRRQQGRLSDPGLAPDDQRAAPALAKPADQAGHDTKLTVTTVQPARPGAASRGARFAVPRHGMSLSSCPLPKKGNPLKTVFGAARHSSVRPEQWCDWPNGCQGPNPGGPTACHGWSFDRCPSERPARTGPRSEPPTGRTKDIPGFDRLTGSLALRADISVRVQEPGRPVTRDLWGPRRPTMWPVMPYLSSGACQAGAVFASGLQRGDEPSAAQVRQAVAAAIRAFGYCG